MVNSFSFQTAVIASSPPSTVMPAFFFFFCFIAPLLEVCFGMVPVIFFSFRQILHQITDFIYEETGGFGMLSCHLLYECA